MRQLDMGSKQTIGEDSNFKIKPFAGVTHGYKTDFPSIFSFVYISI